MGAQLINAGFPGLWKVFQTRNRKGTESYGESGIFWGRYFLRYEMGYAAAISVVLLLLIWFLSKIVFKLLGNNDD